MEMKSLKLFVFATLVFVLCIFCHAESFEFVNRDIGEILYTVSLFRGFPVTADDTVHGNADFRFAGGDFDTAFDAFLKQSRLYVAKEKSGWTVSRIRFTHDGEKVALDAYDVPPAVLVEKVCVETGACITFDALPVAPVSIHTGLCDDNQIINRIVSLCGDYEIAPDDKSSDKKVFHIVKKNHDESFMQSGGGGRVEFNQDENGLWSCDIANAPLSYAAEKLCTKAKREFCIVSGGEGRIVRAQFGGKSFDEMIRLISLQGGDEAVFSEGVYYLTQSKDAKNTITNEGKKWHECHLKYEKAENVIPLVSRRFSGLETISLPAQPLFLYCTDDETAKEIDSFVQKIDQPLQSHIVTLQYLRTSDFLSHLPPFVEKASVFDDGSGNGFYYTGSEDSYKRLVAELPLCDKPVTRISYDLLIMQYQNSDGSEWTPSLRVDRLVPGDMNGLTAELGSVLDFNLDVISAFGLHFAGQLQSAITSSRAHVFADTTLNGVNGSTINFQNTNTYRYRDNNLDPDTGKPVYSGVTREITSGLKLEVTGIVSGDGMITSKITASVSRQGADVSSKTGNPPPTSEKVITTEVRAKSGEPVVLSGLIQNEDDDTVSRTPILSRIPIIGHLFKGHKKSSERTELVIYLVPSAEYSSSVAEKNNNPDETEKKEMVRLYREFVKDEQ